MRDARGTWLRAAVVAGGFLAASGPLARGDDPPLQRLADIRTGAEPRGSNPRQIYATPSWIFAVVDVENQGRELVAADRLTGEVTLRTDLEPGAAGSRPILLAQVGDTVVFQATQAGVGPALWTSDGTSAGTVRRRVIDVPPGFDPAYDSTNADAVVTGGRVFVNVAGRLLVSDDAGATYVELLDEGAGRPTAFSGRVVFVGTDADHGSEPWISDGTLGGTFRIADVQPGPSSGAPGGTFTRAGTGVYFVGDDGVHGLEPWFTDGTEAGTRIVADLVPGEGGSAPAGLVRSGDLVFFRASLDGGTTVGAWRTDGTEPGTFQFASDAAGVTFLASVGGRMIYRVRTRRELWSTDGTPGGTTLLVTFPGSATVIVPIRVLGDRYLFAADPGADSVDSRERALYTTDGTISGTVRVDGVVPTSRVESPESVATGEESGLAYLPATDPAVGLEVVETDGTSEGTRVAANLQPDDAGSHPAPIGILPGAASGNLSPNAPARLVFAATGDGVGREPWITDGTPAGTSLLLDVNPGSGSSDPEVLATLGFFVVFAADDGVHGREPWITDGTPGGTVLLRDVRLGAAGSAPLGPARVVSRRAVFFADDGPHGLEPWVTDGTPDGTRLLHDTVPGPRSVVPDRTADGGIIATARLGADVCFLAQETVQSTEYDFLIASGSLWLWATDGTPDGTHRIAQIGGPESYGTTVIDPTATQGRVQFLAEAEGPNGYSKLTLWSSGGTRATTRPDAVIWRLSTLDVAGPRVRSIAAIGGSLVGVDANYAVFFLRPARDHHKVEYGKSWLDPDWGIGGVEFSVNGERALLSADGGAPSARGRLVVSDGSRKGTHVLEGVGPTGIPRHLTPLGATGRTAFAASDPAFGDEIWTTDGTSLGTSRLADVRTGPESSSPSDFVVLGNSILFAADDGVSGRELWSAAASGTAALPSAVVDLDGNGIPDLADNTNTGYYSRIDSRRLPDSSTDDVVLDRVTARLDFADGAADRCVVSGWWDPPNARARDRSSATSQEIGAFVAGAGTLWSADRSGSAIRVGRHERATGNGRVRIGRTPNGSARFRFRILVRGDFSASLAAFGIDGTRDRTDEPHTLPIFVSFRSNVAATSRTVRVDVNGTRGRWRL